MKVRNRFSEKVAFMAPEGESLTQQHFKDECDINNIIAKYNKTGVITHVRNAKEMYGDFSELAEYANNIDKVNRAVAAFEALPAELRNACKNDVPTFFKFIADPANRAKCEEWGIYEKSDASNLAAQAPTPAPETK